MDKKELLQNLYQIQEFMSSGIFEVQVDEEEEVFKNINEDMQEALEKTIIFIEKRG